MRRSQFSVLAGWFGPDYSLILLCCRRRLFLQDIVAALVGRIYGPGDNIIVEGDTGKEMFFLEAGLVQVIKTQPDGSNKVIVELGKGNFFGEMSLLEARGKTSAGILATTFCDVQVLPKTSFEQIMDDWPVRCPSASWMHQLCISNSYIVCVEESNLRISWL
eukprot:COSAG02_NODE_176_length_31159_cov_30.469833_20_plen_162_part_00